MANTGADAGSGIPKNVGDGSSSGNPPQTGGNSGQVDHGSVGDPDHPTDGNGPDFDAIYAYAALFIDLGDLIYEYAHNVLGEGFKGVTWTGDRESAAFAAWEAVLPLTTLLANSDQHATVPSASRLLWNIGETVNYFAQNLEEQRAEEKKHELAQLIATLVGLFFMIILGGLAFLPATAAGMLRLLNFLGDAIVASLRVLYSGAEWAATLGRGFGDAIVGAALSVGPQLAGTAIGDAAAHLKFSVTPKEIIISSAFGAAGGVMFGSAFRKAVGGADAARAGGSAQGGTKFGVEALPKTSQRAQPGQAPAKEGVGGSPAVGIGRPNPLADANDLRLPAPGRAGMIDANGAKGAFRLDHQAHAVDGTVDGMSRGNTVPDLGARSRVDPARDSGTLRLPELPDLPTPGRVADGADAGGTHRPDDIDMLQARLDGLRVRPPNGSGTGNGVGAGHEPLAGNGAAGGERIFAQTPTERPGAGTPGVGPAAADDSPGLARAGVDLSPGHNEVMATGNGRANAAVNDLSAVRGPEASLGVKLPGASPKSAEIDNGARAGTADAQPHGDRLAGHAAETQKGIVDSASASERPRSPRARMDEESSGPRPAEGADSADGTSLSNDSLHSDSSTLVDAEVAAGNPGHRAETDHEAIADRLHRLEAPAFGEPASDRLTARLAEFRAEHYPHVESIGKVDADARLTAIREQLAAAKDEAEFKNDNDLPVLRQHDDEVLENRLEALRRSEGPEDMRTLPNAASHRITSYGIKDLEGGLSRARTDAKSAGMSPDDIQRLSADVRSAIDGRHLDEAAKKLGTMRDEIDWSQIGRRLDHFRDQMDAGHRRAAEFGMDRVTWLKHGEAIESAAVEGRYGDLHRSLGEFERAIGDHLRIAKMLDQHAPTEIKAVPVDDALQARYEALRGTKPPAETAKPVDTDPDLVQAKLSEIGEVPKTGESASPFDGIRDIADVLKSRRSERVQEISMSDSARSKLSVRADDVDAVMRSAFHKFSESTAMAKVDRYQRDAAARDHRGEVEELRNGVSPLPEAEAKEWQWRLDKEQGARKRLLELFGRESPSEREVMRHYKERVGQYDAEVQSRIANSSFAPDRSARLTQRLDKSLGGLSKELRDKNASENLNFEDRLGELRAFDDRPPRSGDEPSSGGDAPSGGTTHSTADELEVRLPEPPKSAPVVRDENGRSPVGDGDMAGDTWESTTAKAKPTEAQPSSVPDVAAAGEGERAEAFAKPAEHPASIPYGLGQGEATLQRRPESGSIGSAEDLREFEASGPERVEHAFGPERARDVVRAILGERAAPGWADWLYSDDGILGWWPTGKSWSEVQRLADRVGPGGVAVFAPNGDVSGLVQLSGDGELQVVEVDGDGKTSTFDFESYSASHEAPVSVVAIDGDGVVLVPRSGSGPGADVPSDAQQIATLTGLAAVRAQPADGSDLLQAVFESSYPIGVTLKGAVDGMPGSETGKTWLFDGTRTGWRPVADWNDVLTAVRIVGPGGVTLFAPTDGQAVAHLVHQGRDGQIRVIEGHLDGTYQVTELSQHQQTHSPPASVAAIHKCGEVYG
ncbi:hypothetical protein [Actinoplanes solisilvae]|uniref:hypothetical protein n=1 Tax=Actinoplanes solisilvae TaxID=2486853 RepID=UPI000FDC09BF|nr:hypothetical protein [Actinoplanes solisilvae]